MTSLTEEGGETMFLKQLDMIGFKSFAERTSIEFTNGVTAIVGPNGSGKSNIIDAVRWVLGEQSAKSLRGSKMEDVIFNGSDSRKKLNYAEVTLTFDNEKQLIPLEYQEISITRRLYRSGDSDFFINKQPCRLKDITELFMDTGIGKEAYSTIGQGKIDEILNSKPEERRSIFEEAAGVLKYKLRRNKAEQKLAETNDNLHRVEDILYELNNQLEPLEIQSSIAKEYVHTKEELETLEVALMAHEIEQFHHTWEQEMKEKERLEDAYIQQTTESTTLEQQVEKEKTTIQTLDQSLEGLQAVLMDVTNELEKCEGRKKVLEERTHHAASNRQQYETQLEALKVKQVNQSEQREEKATQVKRLKREVHTMEMSIADKEKELASLEENIEDKIEQLKNSYFDLLNEETTLNNEKRYIVAESTKRHVKYERIDQELHDMNVKKQKRSETLQSLQQELEQLRNKQEMLQKTIAAHEAELHAIEAELANREEQKQKAQRIIEQCKTKKEMLESMKEDYAGFNQGVRAVLKQRKPLQVAGAVAELLQVPKKFETAIEMALGASMQHIVTNTSSDAARAIHYLKQQQLGRATFLPLDAIKQRYVDAHDVAQISTENGFIGVASSCVTCDRMYTLVKEHLLGSILITEDLATAQTIAKRLRYRYRIVTLEGDIVSPGGSMTGGSIRKRSSSLLSRTRELEQVIEMTEKMNVQLEQLTVITQALQAKKETITTNLHHATEQREKVQEASETTKEMYREHHYEYQLLEKQLHMYEVENADFVKQKETIESRIIEIDRTLEQIMRQKEQLTSQMDRYETKKQQTTKQRERLHLELTNEKIEHSKRKERLLFSETELKQIMQAVKQIEQEINHLSENLQVLSMSEEETDENKETIKEKIIHLSAQKEQTIEDIRNKRQERFVLSQHVQDEEVRLKEMKREQKQIQEFLREKELTIERVNVELDHRLDRLNETYKLTFERAKQEYPLTVAEEEAKKRVKLLQKTIAELGNVNIGAIEEFERIRERFDFLHVQKNDLEEAKNTLLTVIDEMDIEVKKRFKEAFDEIRYHFQRLFTQLFHGGEADLLLTNPEDLLHTGIEIVAKPPGKKLQHLALLSGGERSLTALCLLFAMIEYRAVPFVILDEVEAALDEVNVVRFGQFLTRFSERTQFIVITHRKATMEQATMLYGVTMQELGVSTMMSVQLQESLQLVKQEV